MSTADDAAAATFAHRERAQSLNAVKASLQNAETLDASLLALGQETDPFISRVIGLRRADLKSVVEENERLIEALAESEARRVNLAETMLRYDAKLLTEREEQREACALRFFDTEHNRDVRTIIRATRLTATPLGDTIKDLRAAAESAANVTKTLTEERDAARQERDDALRAAWGMSSDLTATADERDRNANHAARAEFVAHQAQAERDTARAELEAVRDQADEAFDTAVAAYEEMKAETVTKERARRVALFAWKEGFTCQRDNAGTLTDDEIDSLCAENLSSEPPRTPVACSEEKP